MNTTLTPRHVHHALPHIKSLFTGGMTVILVLLFVVGVALRDREIAFLSHANRSLSAIGYRIEYALGGGQLAAAFLSAQKDSASRNEKTIPVLLYHGIVTVPDRFSLTEGTFKNQMFALKRAGYQTVSMADVEAFIDGTKELPARSFLLTFDDGRRDSFENADPILEALGFKAVMFVATEDSLGDPSNHNSYYLDKSSLQTMLDTGRWELQSHARQVTGGYVPLSARATDTGNFLSNRAWLSEKGRIETSQEYAARIDDELTESKNLLESTFGITVTAFSYPFGDYGQQGTNTSNAESLIRKNVEEEYTVAFQQVWPNDNEFTLNAPGEDMYRLRRIEVDTGWNGTQLLSYLKSAESKSIPYKDTLTTDAGWKHTWGTISFENDALILSASRTTSGALAFLDGSGIWSDYLYTITTHTRPNGTLSLLARYIDGNTMAFCTWGADGVKLSEKTHGVEHTLDSDTKAIGTKLGVRVNGTQIECLTDDVVVLTGTLSPSHTTGGIGVRIWDKTLGRAHAVVDSLSVTPL